MKKKHSPELTRKQRKERQNLLVRYGMPRQETKRLRTYFEYVCAYNQLIDDAIERGDTDGGVSPGLLRDIANEILTGNIGLTSDPHPYKFESNISVNFETPNIGDSIESEPKPLG